MNLTKIFDRFVYTHVKEAFDYLYNLSSMGKQESFPQTTKFIGHRGVFCHPTLKENTFAAFDAAVTLGAGIEFDIRLSSDGIPMVHHDSNLQRVFGIDAEIANHSASEIQATAPVPTLAEVLDRYGEKAPFLFIEDKNTPGNGGTQTSSRIIEAELKKRDLTQKAAVIALKTEIIEIYRQETQDIKLAIIYMVSPKKALEYMQKHSNIGLMGWYATFPVEIEKQIPTHEKIFGCGFLNWDGTARRFARKGFPFLFSDRVDRVIPKIMSLQNNQPAK
ncbi:MAG: glycerophosphodiester phosphodiesterase family protein [Myxococcota bacterium]|nr:glycerophosphodiester phosphodiesterase family protein [Myxococcota bacterium]